MPTVALKRHMVVDNGLWLGHAITIFQTKIKYWTTQSKIGLFETENLVVCPQTVGIERNGE